MLIKCTLAQICAIHAANYSHDIKASYLMDKLERSYSYDYAAVIKYDDEIFGDYCDHLETISN
jgi:hypothetical protein